MIGQTIGHYTILAKLGEGGMGVVYKALDTRLDRTVALKFMPHHITPDDAEEARFLQEAKAASALNHPNVCTIYGIGEIDGKKYIEMEYVEGVTLRQKLPIQSLSEAIAYSVQIADALYDAHQKGIVHRDIKADNIMINSKNQIKVMDFGLAKLKGSLKITKATSTVGTLAYMAPEQIQGGDVDGRSDIFSFGVVLYEMLTGRLPFRSEHEAALMYSIINDEPDPIQKHRTDLPPVLTNMILRALEKDPNERFQSMNEMVIELKRLQKQSTKVSRASLASMPVQPGSSAGLRSSQASIPAEPPRRSKLPLVIGGAATLLAIAAAVWFFALRPSSRVELNPSMSFRSISIPFQVIGQPHLSRDGGWAAFPALRSDNTWDIYMMNVNSGEPRQTTTDSSAVMVSAAFSPDGSQIAYDRVDKGGTRPEIAVVSSLGGSSKRVVETGYVPRWRPDGQRIGYMLAGSWGSKSGLTEIRSVKPNGTDDRLECADSLFIGVPVWSPDGRSIAYARRTPEGHIEAFVRDLESGRLTQLTTLRKTSIPWAWTENGEIVFQTELNGNSNLWMVGSTGGTPVQITRGAGPDGIASVSGDMKRLLFTQEQKIAHVWTGSLADGTSRQLTFDDAQLTDPCFSPDGKRVLYVESKSGGSVSSSSLVALTLDGGGKNVLLSEETNFHSPVWSPDGKWIAVAVHADTVQHDSARTYLIEAENPGTLKLLGPGFPKLWIDNSSLLAKYRTGTIKLTLDGAPPARYFRDSVNASPVLDGTSVVYTHYVFSKNPGVWLAPLSSADQSPPKLLMKSFSSMEYDSPGRALYYLTLKSEFRHMLLPDGPDEKVQWSFPHLTLGDGFVLSADAKQIAYLDSKKTSKLMLIDNLH